jgi:hypothetical protein
MLLVRMLLMAILFCLLSRGPALAAGFGFTFGGGNADHPYPNEPQYQYPRTDGKAMKCSRGQAPYQGKCRPVRWLPSGSPYNFRDGSRPRF